MTTALWQDGNDRNDGPDLAIAPRRLCVLAVDAPSDSKLPVSLPLDERTSVAVERATTAGLDGWLGRAGGHPLAAVVIFTPAARRPATLDRIRARPELRRVRVLLATPAPPRFPLEPVDDVEGCVDLGRLAPEDQRAAIANLARAFRALGTNPLVPQFYLDAAYNDVMAWFEESRWEWSELPSLGDIDCALLDDDERETVLHAAIAEFGTLPGIHNFLREWDDEYSFSSWSVAWGAEESRHALVLTRYLREIGIEVMAKHAMYKREPYPQGAARAGTLMMNIVSESRASEYYKCLYRMTREPVLKTIWRLLSRDEARHAAAFFTFCRELCEHDSKHLTHAMEMGYVWLGDRANGVKHPSGLFYPHSPTTQAFRVAGDRLSAYRASVLDDADARVFSMMRRLTGDGAIHSARDVKAWLRRNV